MSYSALTKTIQDIRKGFNRLYRELKYKGFSLQNPKITPDGHTSVDVYPADENGKQISGAACLFRVMFLYDEKGNYIDITFEKAGGSGTKEHVDGPLNQKDMNIQFEKVREKWYKDKKVTQPFQQKESDVEETDEPDTW
jgi:hypothetical protein